jgi:autotransporter translocation and assembly factor TamB
MADTSQHRSRVLIHWLGLALGVVAILIIAALFVVQTPWAEERARRLIVDRASAALDGELRIGSLTGSLLGDLFLQDVTIVHDGRPAIRAERIRVRYRPIRLWRSALAFDEVDIIRPQVLLAEEDGGWNLAQLARDDGTPAEAGGVGFGIDRLRIEDGTMRIQPADASGRTLQRISLDTSLAFRDGGLTMEIEKGSLQDATAGTAVSSLSTALRLDDGRLSLSDLEVSAGTSAVSGAVTVTLDSPFLGLSVDLKADPVHVRDVRAYVRALETVPDDAVLAVTAKGTGSAMRATFTLASEAGGRLSGEGLHVTLADDVVQIRGPVEASNANLGAWLDDPALGSRIDASTTVDVRLPTESPASLAVTFDARAPSVAFAGYRAAGVEASGTYEEGRLGADVSGAAYGATLSSRVQWQRAGGQLSLDGRYAGVDLRALPATLDVPPLASRATGTFSVSGRAGAWSGRTTIESATIEGATIEPGAAGTFETGGDRIAYGFKGDLRHLDPSRLAAALPGVADALSSFGGSIDASIDLEARGATRETLEGRFTVAVVDSTIGGIVVPSAMVKASVIEHVLAADATFSARDVTDRAVQWSGAGAFRTQGAGTAHLTWPDVRAPFRLEDIVARVEVTLGETRLRDLAIDRVRVAATSDRGTLTVRELQVEGPDVSAAGSGTVALADRGTSSFTYKASVEDLSLLEPWIGRSVSGGADLEGRVTGAGNSPHIEGTLDARQLKTDVAGALTVHTKYTVDVPDLDVSHASARANVDATFVDAGGTRLERLRGTVTYATERIELDLTASQEGRTLEVAGTIVPHPEHQEVHVQRLALSAGPATWRLPAGTEAVVQYASERVAVRDLALLSGDGRIVVDGTIAEAAGPLIVRFERVQLADLVALFPPGRVMTGEVNGAARVTGSPDSPEVTADVWATRGEVDGVAYDRLGGTATYADHRLSVEVQLEAGGLGNLTAVGTIPIGAGAPEGLPPYDLAVQSTAIDLGFFQPLTGAVTGLTGTGRFDLRVTGPSNAPALAGSVFLADAAFAVAATGVAYRRLNADFAISEQTVLVNQLSLEDEDGHPAVVQGELRVPGAGAPTGFDLRVTSTDFNVLDNQFGEMALSAELQLMGTPQTPLVSGTLRVDRALIEASDVLDRLNGGYRAITPASTGVPSGPAQAGDARTGSAFEQSSLSITLAMPGNVVVRGRDLRTSSGPIGLGDINVTLGGALALVKDTGQELSLRGSVEVVRGQYQFQGRRFDIERGSEVRFNGAPSNPILAIEATREISGVLARVGITGTLDRPELTLTSDPPLASGDVLSLIVFNQAMNELQTDSRVSLAARAGAIAAGAIATPIADSVARALDLDQFEIRPTDDAAGASIVVGRQVTERLFVGFTQSLGAQDVSQVSFEYRLNEFLRIVTSFAQGTVDRSQFARRAEAAGIDLFFVIR